MIASVSGTIITRRPDHVVVECGGVGYRVFVSLTTFCDLPDTGNAVQLLIHTVVRDDHIHLHGFMSEAEWQAFGHLVGVSGVGPKLAQAILSGMPPGDLFAAIRAGDAAKLTAIPGVGKKTAARLVVELEGRLPMDSGEGEAPSEAAAPMLDDAASALMNLGYPEAKAKKAVEKALKEAGEGAGLEEVIKAALKRVVG
ncbi:MAG: Holliday junction branch migration protein RuvA [Desulfarculaceae bacterium]|nr:Holliday junction branch migration protein RuvA [Desulfarculaceae bacterium]MCF8072736.1 Holliday junction branch migration protein RuvA [Desulfarculaceae bacterium]MCF8103030.1 Holliday junction branch migration protein RuvA [Desulfarculaceae bacterium]MCF8118105.1 Holliday junction branch migration protein RuvA [Desulfarculaceae bacterium]